MSKQSKIDKLRPILKSPVNATEMTIRQNMSTLDDDTNEKHETLVKSDQDSG